MKTVKVSKDALRRIVETNRNKHREVFLKAQKRFREEAVKRLDNMLEEARQGIRIRQHLGLIEPQDHTTDYDRILRMLDMAVEDTVEISQEDFARYVQDEWGWRHQWAESVNSYLADDEQI